ncbi:MAG: phage tail protein [Acinetobacter sp.]|nr:phage tail protein [Acinetobacter sp.]
MADQIYYSVFTEKGLELLTESIQNGTKLGITSMAFGDGAGYLPTPDPNFTSLVNEVHRTQLNSLAPDPNNKNWLRAEAIIASATGGFNIRELGLYAGDILVAYSNYPPTFKPNPADGTARIMTFRMVLQIDNVSSFELVIDPDVVLATIQYVNNYMPIDEKVLLPNGRTQRNKNEDVLNLLDFLTSEEFLIYKSNPENIDIHDAWVRAVFASSFLHKKLIAQGAFYTDKTLKLYCSSDLACATIFSSNQDIAIEIASLDYSYLNRLELKLPKIISTLKNGNGWDSTGEVGVRTVNLNVCEIYLPLIRSFKVGLNVHSTENKGNCYSRYNIGHLDNNKINLMVSADQNSWTNENKYFGGRFSHNSSEGNNVPGVRHIFIKASSYVPNQNIFYSPSIEGNAPEFHVEDQGCWGAIDNARWEASPPKLLYSVDESLDGNEFSISNQGTRNLISHGYNVDAIKVTHSGTGSRKLNRIIGSNRDIRNMSSDSGGDRLKNAFSDHSAFETVFSTNQNNIAEANINEYVQQRTPYHYRGKRATDAFPRIELDFQTGEVRLGNGTQDPNNAAVIRSGTTTLSFNKTLLPTTNEILNIGSSTSRYLNVFSSRFMYTATIGDFMGTGSPEGILTANVGSTYRRSDGTPGTTFYVKETGTGNTGWVAK